MPVKINADEYDANTTGLIVIDEEEYELSGDTWDLVKTQEGDFETQIDQAIKQICI